MNTQTYTTQTTGFFTSFIAQVYGWMSLGLLVSFGISFVIYFLIYNNPQLFGYLYLGMFISLIFQLILVFVIAGRAARMSAITAGLLFVIYSALNGITLVAFTLYYEIGTIIIAFFASFLTFAVMSVLGVIVKRDLTGLGGLALFGLIGVIIGSLINFVIYFIFPQLATGISWILTYVGLGIFIILVAYDTQKLKQLAASAESSGFSPGGLAVQGALTLYLDFINIFLRLLAIFGRRR